MCGGGNGRCRKGEGNDVREMWGSVGGSVLGPHALIHFATPPPFLSPHSFPTRQHTSPLTPYTLPHPSPHFSTPHTSFLPLPTPQHTSLHLPPHPPYQTIPYLTKPYQYLFPQLPSPPPTPQLTSHSPHALSRASPSIFPHSFDDVATW